MAKIAGTTPAAQRRAAQRRLAKQIREGNYQRGQAGRAYQQARTRQRAGRDIGVTETPKGKGYGQRQFSSIADAMTWGQANITPRRTRCYLTGYGRFHAEYVDEGVGRLGYRTITGYIRAMSLGHPDEIAAAENKAGEVFAELKYVILRWEL